MEVGNSKQAAWFSPVNVRLRAFSCHVRRWLSPDTHRFRPCGNSVERGLALGKHLLCGVLSLSLVVSVEAANFPPVAKLSAEPIEALESQPIEFSSVGSVDPDGQPSALSFYWEFGDGNASSNANPIHAFATPGAFRVSLTVDDGADTTVALVTVYILAPSLADRPSASSPLALSPDDRWLWVVNPDSDSVTILDLQSVQPVKAAELAVAAKPRSVAFNATGERVFITCQSRNELWVFDTASRQRLHKLRVGHQPFGVAVSPLEDQIVVSNQGAGTVHLITPELVVERVLEVGDSPRAIAITADGTRAYVSHFITRGDAGAVTEIDLAARTVTRVIPLVEDMGPDTPSSGRGFPNLLSTLAVEPSGRGLWVGGLKSNSGRGLFNNGLPLMSENTVRGFFGRIGVATGMEDLIRRVDLNNGDSASAIAFSSTGRYAYVAHQGAGMVSVYDLTAATLIPPGDGAVVPFLARIDSGHAPQGIVITRDGRRAFVANYLSRDISALDLDNSTNPIVAATISTTTEPLPANVANGQRLFYRSRAPRHSRDNYIACASCHADGSGHDGQTWDFTQRGEGLRNTTDLSGRGGMDHGPVHWTGNFDEIQDFENDIVREFGGDGLANDGQPPHPPLGQLNAGRSVDLDDLAAYVNSLSRHAPSPYRRYDGALTSSARRGKELFEDGTLGCASCHNPPRFTDSVLTASPVDYVFHDVGTLKAASGQRLGGTLTGLDTPSLNGLWVSAPYLHDGSASTAHDVLVVRNPNNQHGMTTNLTVAQIADLDAYLLSLDGTNDDGPLDQDQDGMTDAWEDMYGLSSQDPEDANSDLDGDGASNGEEFQAGTDPTEFFSRFFIRQVWHFEERTWLSFPTVAGVQYALESAPQPGGIWDEVERITGDGAERIASNVETNGTQRFYRLRIVAPQLE